MPLSEPVDTNPIVKEPPTFQDGDALPGNNVATTIDQTNLGAEAVQGAYDADKNEFHILQMTGSFTVNVYNGLSNTIKRTYNLPETFGFLFHTEAGAEYYQGHFYLFAGDPQEVWKIDESGPTIVEKVGLGEVIQGLTFDNNGNMITFDSNSNVVKIYDGFSNSVTSTVDVSGSVTNGQAAAGIANLNGNLVILASDPYKVYTFDGFSASLLSSAALTNVTTSTANRLVYTCSKRKSGDKDQLIVCGNANLRNETEYTAFALNNVDNGVNFTGNSGKTLETGKIYSFEITGPNTVTDPTLNDDSQGQFGIVLPGGASIPVGTLSGALDFLFDGSNYVLQTITRGLAQSIYMDEQDALTAQDTATVDNTYGSEEAGVIQNNRTRIAEIQTALQNNGILPTP